MEQLRVVQNNFVVGNTMFSHNIILSFIVYNDRITRLISIIAGFIYNLAPQAGCDSYLDNEVDPVEVMSSIMSNCGCDDFLCRDLNIVPIPHPISAYRNQYTCKQTATADCKSSVQDLFYVWIKVPTKDDKICRDLYNRTKIWATSCN